MPEAVNSDSTTVSSSQYDPSILSVKKGFEEVQHMLNTFNVMTCTLLETKEDNSEHSFGLHLLHGLVMERLDIIANEFEQTLQERQLNHRLVRGSDVYSALIQRIGRIVADAYCSTGRNLVWDEMVDWSREDTQAYSNSTAHYYRELIDRLEGEDDLLEVGSLLPWLELKIRKDIGLSISMPAKEQPILSDDVYADPKNLRDQFIVEKLKQGFSLPHISQALNVKISAIEKAIKKLTGENQVTATNQAA